MQCEGLGTEGVVADVPTLSVLHKRKPQWGSYPDLEWIDDDGVVFKKSPSLYLIYSSVINTPYFDDENEGGPIKSKFFNFLYVALNLCRDLNN